MDSVKPIYKFLLGQNSQVVQLVTHGRALHELKIKLKPHINQYVKGSWQIGQFSAEEITLLVDSAEIANRLRYQLTNLMADVRKLAFFKTLNKINIKVAPTMTDTPRKTIRPKNTSLAPSRPGQQHLKSLADTVEDEELKASLIRLADHLKP